VRGTLLAYLVTYRIQADDATEPPPSANITVPATALTVVLENLQPGTTYRIGVRAINELGEGLVISDSATTVSSVVPATSSGDNNSIIIGVVVASVVVFVILTILFFHRRDIKRREAYAEAKMLLGTTPYNFKNLQNELRNGMGDKGDYEVS
jgi:mannitol-specific phosphotransferase system IIBC component